LCQGIPQKVLLKFDNGLDLLDVKIMKEIKIPQWFFKQRAKNCPFLLTLGIKKTSLDSDFLHIFENLAASNQANTP
jgi:hypothetical protein